MGNRKPAVKNRLKKAARKHAEGKLDEAQAIAESAGEAAAKSKDSRSIDNAAQELALPKEIVATANKIYLELTLPAGRAPNRPGNWL